MPASISHSPLPTSPATAGRIPFLVQLFLGGSLAAVVLFLGLIVWRLAHLPHSGRPMAERARPVPTAQSAAERPAPVPAVLPTSRQTVVEVEPRNEDADLVPKVDVPVSEPDAKAASVDLPRAPEPLTADQIFEQRLQVSEDELRRQLYDVPELRLLPDEDVRDLRAKQAIAMRDALKTAVAAVRSERMRVRAALTAVEKRARSAAAAQARRSEAAFTAAAQQRVACAFNRKLQQSMQQAASRAGLALQRGPSCRLVPNEAGSVAKLSKELRDLGFVTALAAPSPRRDGRRNSVILAEADENEDAAVRRAKTFQKWCDQHGVEWSSGAVPTLAQMLQIEDEPTRLLLVRELARIQNTASTAKLAERAIVDLSPEVRRAAVAALSRRSPRQYVPLLTRGLRYPWPPVADHAALALRTLKPQEAVAPLVALLDLPSPSVPVLDARTQQYTVPELVRLNHMRNCLLCHAISANKEDGLVRGLVPTPGLPLPNPTSGGGNSYYEAVKGDFIRADTTYVHQDFSVVLLDDGVAPWPRAQRYDFLTRRRTVPPELANGLASLPTNYPQRDAVLYALRGITGKDGGDSSDKWRELLGIAKEDSPDRRSIPPLESGITAKASTPP